MAATATLKSKNAERISRNLGVVVIDVALTGTYSTGGESIDLDQYFRKFTSTTVDDLLFVSFDADDATASGKYRYKYDYANEKILIYTGLGGDTELFAGESLTALSNIRMLCVEYHSQGT